MKGNNICFLMCNRLVLACTKSSWLSATLLTRIWFPTFFSWFSRGSLSTIWLSCVTTQHRKLGTLLNCMLLNLTILRLFMNGSFTSISSYFIFLTTESYTEVLFATVDYKDFVFLKPTWSNTFIKKNRYMHVLDLLVSGYKEVLQNSNFIWRSCLQLLV